MRTVHRDDSPPDVPGEDPTQLEDDVLDLLEAADLPESYRDQIMKLVAKGQAARDRAIVEDGS